MTIINDPPLIWVDLGNADVDGAVRLSTHGALKSIESQKVILREGLLIRISDDEICLTARASFRDGIWVAIIHDHLPTSTT